MAAMGCQLGIEVGILQLQKLGYYSFRSWDTTASEVGILQLQKLGYYSFRSWDTTASEVGILQLDNRDTSYACMH